MSMTFVNKSHQNDANEYSTCHDHQVEAFLMNPSFTSKGGFRISINGVRIYQVITITTSSLPKIVKIVSTHRGIN